MNLWDILIAALVIAIVVLGVWHMRKRKKSGKCACGDCASCQGCGLPPGAEEK